MILVHATLNYIKALHGLYYSLSVDKYNASCTVVPEVTFLMHKMMFRK